MFSYKYLILLFFVSFSLIIKSEELLDNNLSRKKNSLDWQYVEDQNNKQLIWQESKNDISGKSIGKKKKKPNKVNSLGRTLKVNGKYLPEISHYVPNAFLEDKNKKITSSFRYISKTRFCVGENFSSTCSDGVVDFDFNLFSNEKYSFSPKINIQSLSNRGTSLGQGVNLGFKAAKKISSTWYLAFGGENILHFDETIDLGRNFYLVFSSFYPKYKEDSTPKLFYNLGIGSDFYGYGGNGYLARTTCFGKPNLTGNGTELCNWGPIGSIAYTFNNRFALIGEWFGYGYGTGISFRPFDESSLSLSVYLTDFISNFPDYIKEHCPSNNCEPRLYSGITFSF